MKFTKMHGLGNDYIYINTFTETTPENLSTIIPKISNRNFGIGSDGLILLSPPTDSTKADIQMIMYNSDGSMSEMCGNGLRCVAKLAYDSGVTKKTVIKCETGAGILEANLDIENNSVKSVTIMMGKPYLMPKDIPVISPAKTSPVEISIVVPNYKTVKLTAVGMGNPHAICFVEDAEKIPLEIVGPYLECHKLFPNKSNIEFVSILPNEEGLPVLKQRTWERGAGETLACGTGACACAVAAILQNKISSRKCIMRLSGGDLLISWDTNESPVFMQGGAETVFSGEIDC